MKAQKERADADAPALSFAACLVCWRCNGECDGGGMRDHPQTVAASDGRGYGDCRSARRRAAGRSIGGWSAAAATAKAADDEHREQAESRREELTTPERQRQAEHEDSRYCDSNALVEWGFGLVERCFG